jgi:predicted DNA-binding transcriptional regulator AlpA
MLEWYTYFELTTKEAFMTTNHYHYKLLSAGETAAILGLKESTLAQFRWRGDKRLPWVKLGKSIRYKLSDIESFIERSTVGKGA